MNLKLQAKPFYPKTASESEYVALNKFSNRMQSEYWPEDPPRTVEETMRNWRFLPSFFEENLQAIWGQNQIVALANAEVSRTEDNQHLVWFEIEVLPEYRKQGIAKGLLQFVCEIAQEEKRKLLMSFSDSAIPAGAAFMNRLNAQAGMESRTNQLTLSALDSKLIQSWQGQGPANEFSLGIWEGAFPEGEIEKIAAMRSAIVNSMPRENLALEDRKITKEELRERERSFSERKIQRWTMYAKHNTSGEFAGYTEVFWEISRPETLNQGDTGVYPKYRNHGLGRWLKASMTQKILREIPQAKRIRTGNANSNAPMLKINYEMGFKPYKSWTTWQIELEKVLKYLEETHAAKAVLASRK
jgi:GNAT superfamily N-acetyltransferase